MQLRVLDNPPNPYVSAHHEWLEPPPAARIEIYEETSGSILSRNDSPDLPFTWSANPYRGCQHACAYCYARPYHEYLGLGAGTDFDTKLIVKRNAATLLRKEISKRTWKKEMINFSGITDCYQPIEAAMGITRQCLEVCMELSNPVSVVTKGFLVVRDADLLCELHRRAGAKVFVSIPFADADAAKHLEPQAPPPDRRFEAIRRLRDAGVPVGVFVCPIIPGLSDRDIPRVLEQAAQAGANSASFGALRLPGSVEQVFLKRLRAAMPLQADRIISRLRETRGGRMNDSRFGHRMRGDGAYWDSITELFAISSRRYGLDGADRTNPAAGPTQARDVEAGVRPGEANSSQLRFDFGA